MNIEAGNGFSSFTIHLHFLKKSEEQGRCPCSIVAASQEPFALPGSHLAPSLLPSPPSGTIPPPLSSSLSLSIRGPSGGHGVSEISAALRQRRPLFPSPIICRQGSDSFVALSAGFENHAHHLPSLEIAFF